MSGGTLLGEGAYGCAFRPQLLCKADDGKVYKGKGDVVKVVRQHDSDAEVSMGEAVQKIPLWQNYFSPVIGRCDVATKQYDDDIEKCNILEENPWSKLELLSLTFAGNPLTQADMGVINTGDAFWAFAKHILEGLCLLTLNGIVHRDLHRGNIVMDAYGVGRIIDFGIAFLFTNANKKDIMHDYDPHYTQEPPEYNLWVVSSPQKYIDDILKKKPAAINARSILGVSLEEQESSVEEFLESSRSFKARDFPAFWRSHWSKYDSWSIGGLLTAVLKQVLIGPAGRTIEKSPRMAAMKRILKGMLEMNPFKRLDAIVALNMWDPDNRIIRQYGAQWLGKLGK